jgi:hypothetical protein
MDLTELLGLDDLLAQLILAVGAAMVIGNGFAIFQHGRGRHPAGGDGDFRGARAWWLLAVGLLITLWAIGSLATA